MHRSFALVAACCSCLALSACEPGTGGGGMCEAERIAADCPCTEPGRTVCGSPIGFGYDCCGGRWGHFADGPCAPPPDGSVSTCGTPSPGCPCDNEGAIHCRSSLAWRLRCTGGVWEADVGWTCC